MPASRIVLLGKTYDAATIAFVNAMTVKPTQARVVVIDTAVRALKSSGLWQKMGLFYMPAAHNAQAGGLNWVTPAVGALTAVNSPSFVTDRGYTGDGATSYLETGIAQNAIPNFSMNSAHAGAWNLTAGTGFSLGLSASTLITIGTTSTRSVRLNGTGAMATTADGTTGYVLAVRRDAVNLYSYKNGATEVTAANASSGNVASTVEILKGNTTYYTGQVACAHVGNQLSASDAGALYTIIQNYLHAVGAV